MNVRLLYRTQTASTTLAEGSHGVELPCASPATPKAQNPPHAGAKVHGEDLNTAALSAERKWKV